MKKKNILFEFDDEISNECILWGIISSAGHVKLIHFLNKTGFFDFERIENVEYNDELGLSYFICYSYYDEETESKYKLLVNRGSNGTIDKKLKNIDIVLSLITESNEIIERAFDIIKNHTLVEAIFEIDISKQSQKFIKILN